MLFRALFWIAIVLVFMPRDPAAVAGVSSAGAGLEGHAGLAYLHDALLSRLAEIKTDIEAEQRARSGRLF